MNKIKKIKWKRFYEIIWFLYTTIQVTVEQTTGSFSFSKHQRIWDCYSTLLCDSLSYSKLANKNG